MRSYAFITGGRSNFPDPFLVEISRRTRTRQQQVAFFEPDVVYCPSFANRVVKSLLEDDHVFAHWATLNCALVEYLVKFGESGTEEQAKEVAVESVVVAQAAEHVDSHFARQTRKSSQVQDSLLAPWLAGNSFCLHA